MAPNPRVFTTRQHILDGWTFLEHLDRPDIISIDATGDAEDVYAALRESIRIRQQ